MRLMKRTRTLGGWLVTVERVAYSRGRTKAEQVFVSDEELAGLDGEGVLAVVRRAIEHDPFATVLGADFSRVEAAPPRESIAKKLESIAEKLPERAVPEERRP